MMRVAFGAALLLIAASAAEAATTAATHATTTAATRPAPAVTPAQPAPLAAFQKGITRIELAAVLSSYGLTVSDGTTKDADPWVVAKTAKGTEFYVNMFDCDGDGPTGRRCANLQFLAQWELPNADLDSANAYNQKFVFGRAYLSKDGKMFMFDYSIDIKDGVSVGNLKRHVDNWLRVLDDVRTQLKI
jgi:Putative bacterial sensory transduction regulator